MPLIKLKDSRPTQTMSAITNSSTRWGYSLIGTDVLWAL